MFYPKLEMVLHCWTAFFCRRHIVCVVLCSLSTKKSDEKPSGGSAMSSLAGLPSLGEWKTPSRFLELTKDACSTVARRYQVEGSKQHKKPSLFPKNMPLVIAQRLWNDKFPWVDASPAVAPIDLTEQWLVLVSGWGQQTIQHQNPLFPKTCLWSLHRGQRLEPQVFWQCNVRALVVLPLDATLRHMSGLW